MKTITEYTVKYKMTGDWFWKHVKNVIGDDTLYRIRTGNIGEDTLPIRTLFLKDGSRYEIPMNNTIILFPKERQIMIKESIDEGKG